MENTFDRLINQIDAFIRKYYANEIVKGTLLPQNPKTPSYFSIERDKKIIFSELFYFIKKA